MRSRRPIAALVAVAATVIAACSDSGPDEPEATAPRTTPPLLTVPPTEPAVEEAPAFADGPLAEVCPATIVVQTESLPHPRHGGLYALLASNPTIDGAGQSVTAPLRRTSGEIDDVSLQIRSGGPAVAFRSPLELQSAATGGDPIHLAEVAFSELAVVGTRGAAVVALGGANDDMIMWDPATYPSVETFADLAALDVEIRHVVGERFVDYLVATGELSAGQLTERGGPELAGFIAAGGEIARQGDAVVDPALLPSIPQWDREIAVGSARTAGWDDVDRLLVADGSVDDECLGRLVPIIQAAIAAYADQPGPVNELLSELRTRFNPLDRVGAPVLDDAVRRAVDAGRWNDDFDGAPGVVDLERLEAFADDLAATLELELRPLDDVIATRFVVDDPD